MLLSEIDEPKKVRITKIHSHWKKHKKKDCVMGDKCSECLLVKHLADLGFIRGREAEVLEVGLFGSPMIVKVIGASYALCKKVSEHIEVEILK